MILKKMISRYCLVKRIMSRHHSFSKIVLYSLLIAVITFPLFFLSEQICLSKGKIPIVTPSTITLFAKTGFDNHGRQWTCSAAHEAYIKDGILYISSDGSDRSILLITAPGEYADEKKIIISGQKNLVVEFDKPIEKHVVFEFEVIMEVANKLEEFEQTIDCFDKSRITVPLSPRGRTLHYLLIRIKSEKATLGIKSIFLE